MTVTKEEQDRLRNQVPEPHQTLEYTMDDDATRTYVHMSVEAERQGKLNHGDRIMESARNQLEIDHAFASREGLARAQFEVRAAERHAIDVFNGYADEPGRAEHELLVAEDRLANAVDDYIEHYEDPALEPAPEMVRRVEELNRDVVQSEEHHRAIHNNGLPLDPPLDVEREKYIRETTSRDEDHRELSREQYIEQTTQPSHGRPIDRTHSR